MESSRSLLEKRIARLRPVLLTLAEALIAPALRVELDASDLVQQTLMEAYQQSRTLASYHDGPFFGWLRSALRHNVVDAVRHLKTQKNNAARVVRRSDIEDSFNRLEELFIADNTSASGIAQRKEQTAQLLAAIQELPPKQRQAVIMKHLRGCSLRQVAEELGLSESATAGLLHRGRKQLAERLEDSADG